MADEGDKIDALDIDASDRIYALVSAAAYCPNRQRRIENYILISTTETMVVYQYANEIIYGFRGTSNNEDILTNIVMGLRGVKNTSRYKRDKGYLEELISIQARNLTNILGPYFQKKKNGKRRATVYESIITFTGHSLGGSIAIQIYKEIYNQPGYNSKCVVFDPYLPLDQKSFIPSGIDQKNIKIYRIKGDIVSINVVRYSNSYQTVTLPKKKTVKDVHSLHQFVDYKDEGDVCVEGKEYEEMVMRF